MSIRVVIVRALCAVFLLSCLGASCGQRALGLMPGVVNDPSNLSLRRAVFEFGRSRICPEVQKRGLPLKAGDEDPVIGRFFPTTCFTQQLANNNLLVQFEGSGFAWTNLTQRMSFGASGAVEYDTDFLMDGSTMYVYFRQKSTPAANFTIKLVEQPQALTMAGTPIGVGAQGVANSLGAQLLKGEISKGFTVIRAENGDVAFGLGVIEKGGLPRAPFRVNENGQTLLANERSEVHQNQRDFVGPIEVPSGARLSINLAIDGAPAIDVLLLPRSIGEIWLQTYTTQAVTTPPPGLPMLDEPVFSGASWHRDLTLPAGLYYLVLDNTATAGRSAPPGYARDDRAALVSYAIALDD
jgi:hypothetical protein